MRLPGSHNSKNGEWIPVRMIEQRSDTYTIEQIEQWLVTEKPRLARRTNPKTKTSPKRNGGESNPWLALSKTQAGPVDVEQRLAEMQYHGTDLNGIHDTQLSVTAALLTRGWPIEDVVSRVLQATVEAAGPEGRGWNWREEERGLRKMCRKWLEKHPRIVFFEEPAPHVELSRGIVRRGGTNTT
jgi:hypothetical protein